MQVIVFAKGNSKRVPNKNFREFHDGNSLLDIALSKLGLVPRSNIWISSEDPEKLEGFPLLGYQTILRNERFTRNDTPISDVLRDAVMALPDDGQDVMFVMVCDPLLQDLDDIYYTWEHVRNHGYDSLGLVVPQREYLLNHELQPQGFGFGYDHVPSQQLPPTYRVNFAVSIVKRDAFDSATAYHVLKRPFWYHVNGPSVDIDTMSDFRAAQALYAAGV